MVDIVARGQDGYFRKYRDMGDGSFAEVHGIVGNEYSCQVSLIRPADTAPYVAGDVIGTTTSAGGAVIELPNIGPANGGIIITDIDFAIHVGAIPSGMGAFRYHLFNALPPSNLGDNAQFVLAAADRACYLGYIDAPLPVNMGSTLFSQPTPQVPKKLRMGTTTSLWMYKQTIAGYTPTSGAVKLIRFNAVGL